MSCPNTSTSKSPSSTSSPRWEVIDHRALGILGIPESPSISLRENFRETILPEVFRRSMRHINRTDKGEEWLTEEQLDQMRHDISAHPGKTLIEANSAAYDMLLKHTVGDHHPKEVTAGWSSTAILVVVGVLIHTFARVIHKSIHPFFIAVVPLVMVFLLVLFLRRK